MDSTAHNFKKNAAGALNDAQLQRALAHVPRGFVKKRADAADALPEFERLRDQGRDIKNHVLEHLDIYLEAFEEKVVEAGGYVHWATTAEEARNLVVRLCLDREAETVTKGKSMISEEIGLNAGLEKVGIEPVETDLGEYIIQLRGETPSHLIAPAVHLNKDQIEADFRRVHTELPEERNLHEPASLVHEAREILRDKYLDADVGITGANFLIAETGTSVIVTNEGNGDLTQILPKTHIVIASIEKVVPTLEDASTFVRLLARSATGQEISNYTTFSTGPKRRGDPDGPNEYHVVLLDNGRSSMLGTEFQDMLRCIRCGACLNHCPVYQAVGGHAYGWVYSGPMGSVLTPNLIGVDEAGHLPNASTFCGRCEEVCPMRIPLPRMMRNWREREFEKHLTPFTIRRGLGVWAWFAQRPKLYQRVTALASRLLKWRAGSKGRMKNVPLADGWVKYRDLPAPQGKTFQQMWKERGNV
ncbi:MAG: iron-sulfur cluster-binding protein [Alphaproteobacteria bacterium]|nr:iron-sulfur cluster-binding protein [Alphaproteobacteria bacterium]